MKKFLLSISFFLFLLPAIVSSYSYSQYLGHCGPIGNITVYETTNVLVANVTFYNVSGILFKPGCYLNLHRFNVPDTAAGLPFLNVGEVLTFYINDVKANTTPSIVTWTGILGPYSIDISTCNDNDLDHYWVSSLLNFSGCGLHDCDDTNPYIFPANSNTNCTCPPNIQPETCDGIDNNCNGLVDDNVIIACNSDSGCGSTGCSNGTYYTFSCHNPGTCLSFCTNSTSITDTDSDGYDTECDSDCDDADASVYPGASELCDGVDNDCDSEIDEGCVVPPPPQPCNHNHICESGEGCGCSDCFGQACTGGFCSSNENCKSNCTIVKNESLVLFDLFPFAKKAPSNLNIYVETFDYWILDKYGNMLPVEVGIKSW